MQKLGFGLQGKVPKFVRLSTFSEIQRSHYGSKVPSDEKLIDEILSEKPEDDDVGEKPSYRKQSSLAKFQNTDRTSSVEKSDNEIPSIGPKYWRAKYRKAYRKVEQGLTSPLDDYISKNIDVIKSYNEKKKKTLEERIKVDYKKTLHWNDIIPNKALYRGLVRYLSMRMNNPKNVITNDDLALFQLTSYEQRFFSLMSGHLSTVAKGPSGSGKSFSLLIRALASTRPRGKGAGINSLILVKSNELVFQYQNVINEILTGMKSKTDINNVAQFLYRGTPEEEAMQEKNMGQMKNPHILVATPQRLLDIISSKGMDFVKIDSLSFIGIDDFTSMLDKTMLLETARKPPVVTLMDFVIKLQDFKRKYYNSRPQVAIITDEAATESLIQQLKEYTNWIDWNKFAQIGKFGEDEDIPFYKYVSEKSSVSTVLTLPRVLGADSKKFKVSLFDMKPFQYGDSQTAWLTTLYRRARGNAEAYQKHRKTKWSKLPQEVKTGELEILCFGLGKLLKKKDVTDWLQDGKRALVVHADELNSATVVESLSGKTKRKVAALNIKVDSESFTTLAKDENDTRLYVTNISSLNGITLRNLDTIFVLGVDSIKDEQNLSMIMGRARDRNGLIPESEYSLFSIPSGQNMENYTPRSRTFIIVPLLPDGTVDPLERNFLERAFIVNGLVKQQHCVGVEEKWTNEAAATYETVLGDSFADVDENGEGMYASGGIQFGGLHHIEANNETERS